jgi:DNA invertase Pin-like site-specific DNA recombinase
MNCAIYARVSTQDQNCAMQIRELKDYIKRRRWTLVGEYVDTAVSGSKASRPQLDRIMADAKQHLFDVILCWKLDRWGRSVSHISESLHALQSAGVRWIVTTQNLDTDVSNPMSMLMLHMLAAFAQFERDLIRERTRSSLAKFKDAKTGRCTKIVRGKRCGRPLNPFDRGKVAELRSAGWSWRAIAASLKVPFTTVRRALPGVPKPA